MVVVVMGSNKGFGCVIVLEFVRNGVMVVFMVWDIVRGFVVVEF